MRSRLVPNCVMVPAKTIKELGLAVPKVMFPVGLSSVMLPLSVVVAWLLVKMALPL